MSHARRNHDDSSNQPEDFGELEAKIERGIVSARHEESALAEQQATFGLAKKTHGRERRLFLGNLICPHFGGGV
jgi:hypothetical protein